MDKGTQAGQCEEARNCSVCVGQQFVLTVDLNFRGELRWVCIPHICSGKHCCPFCPSGPMLEELLLHGCWGLLGKLSVAREFPSALTSSSRTLF